MNFFVIILSVSVALLVAYLEYDAKEEIKRIKEREKKSK
jgi:hypothetical protein